MKVSVPIFKDQKLTSQVGIYHLWAFYFFHRGCESREVAFTF